MKLRQKLHFVILIFFFSFPALAESYSGYVSIFKNRVFTVLEGSNKKYELIAYTEDTISSLKKLKDRDYITVFGSKSDSTILVESIDFVGLRQLLGLWVSNNTWLNFRDFNNVNVYWQDVNTTQKVLYEYSISPDPGKNWKIFFAGNNEVVIADLELNPSSAKINYFDSKGVVVKTVELTKLSNYR
jgi:hypothetical protein